MAIRTKEFYEFQNKVMDNLRDTNLSKNESKYCWTLFRETCGYGNYKVKISRDRISELTRILETHVSRTERRLKERNIIIINRKYKGFNPDISKWEKVPLLVPIEKVPLLVQKGTSRAEKKGTATGTLRTKKKEDSKEGGILKVRNREKEIDKLEGKEWLRANMIELQGYSEEFTDRFLSKAEFKLCYDAWDELQNAYSIRDRKAWLLAKLERGPVPEE